MQLSVSSHIIRIWADGVPVDFQAVAALAGKAGVEAFDMNRISDYDAER